MESVERGLKARTVLACLSAMLATALWVQFLETIEASAIDSARQAVPVAAMMVVVPLVLVIGGIAALTGFRLLNRAEMLAVIYCSMMTAPFASAGFWLMLIGPLGTIPKTAYFEVYDGFPAALWPHSGNVLAGSLSREGGFALEESGTVEWRQVERERDGMELLPVLRNNAPDDRAAIRITAPLADAGDTFDTTIVLDEPYLLSVLTRASDLGSGAEYFCRVYTGGKPEFDQEVFSAREPGEVNFLHPLGYRRLGVYNFTLPPGTAPPVEIEIGLAGKGELVIADVELISVGALDAIYRGRQTITQDLRDELPPGPVPHRLLEKPDGMLSLDGATSAISGVIPWKHWLRPFSLWSAFGILVLMGTLAIGALMHRQWIDNERYPLPNTRIPAALLGAPGEEESSPLSRIWGNRVMWTGFAVSLFWCLMKGWHAYNPNVPDMRIEVDLSPYFADPAWGRFWRGTEVRNVTFAVTAVLLSIAIFLELNVLFSLALGFLLFRVQYLFGEATGLALKQDFPYYQQQMLAAFLVYGLVVLFFARRHLAGTLREALWPNSSDRPHAAMSYRSAWGLLAFSLCAIAVWSAAAGIPIAGMLLFYGIILLVGFVAMKLRAECGVVTGWFGPVMIVAILPFTGGMLTHGPQGVIFICIASYAIFQYLFFLAPGMQLEMMELGRQYRIPAGQVLAVLILGAIGAVVVSGWVHLSLGFGIGGDNYAERWPYMDKTFILHEYNMALADANLSMLPADAPEREGAGSWTPAHWACLFGGGVTLVLTFLRQAFSGFWFHPIGFIVGASPMMELAWGSILAAGIIRYLTFRIGGSHAVRTKLMPFFVGVFIGAVAAYLLFGCMSAYFYFYRPEILRRDFGGIL